MWVRHRGGVEGGKTMMEVGTEEEESTQGHAIDPTPMKVEVVVTFDTEDLTPTIDPTNTVGDFHVNNFITRFAHQEIHIFVA